MDDTPLPAALEDQMLAHLEAALPAYDLVHRHRLWPRLPRPAHRRPARRSRPLPGGEHAGQSRNLGFHVITRYPRADYLCIDEGEARLATRDRWSPLAEVAGALRARVKCSAMSVTLAQRGSWCRARTGSRGRSPPLARDVVDRMGAGDAYLSVSSPCAAAGLPLDVVALLGSAAGALALRIVGNRSSVEPDAVERLARRAAGLRPREGLHAHGERRDLDLEPGPPRGPGHPERPGPDVPGFRAARRRRRVHRRHAGGAGGRGRLAPSPGPARAELRDQPHAEYRPRAGGGRVAGLPRRRQRVGARLPRAAARLRGVAARGRRGVLSRAPALRAVRLGGRARRAEAGPGVLRPGGGLEPVRVECADPHGRSFSRLAGSTSGCAPPRTATSGCVWRSARSSPARATCS